MLYKQTRAANENTGNMINILCNSIRLPPSSARTVGLVPDWPTLLSIMRASRGVEFFVFKMLCLNRFSHFKRLLLTLVIISKTINSLS